MPAPSTNKYMAQDERRQQLLDLGLELFGARAFDEVSIDDIANVAGISRGLMYHYFGSKRQFYLDVLHHGAHLLLEHIQPDVARSPEENLRASLKRVFRFASEHDRTYLMVLNGGVGSDKETQILLDEVRDEIVQRMLSAVPYVQVTPLIKTLARGWLSSVETAAIHMLRDKSIREDDLIHYLGASLMSMLAMVLSDESSQSQDSWQQTITRAIQQLSES